jgi:hypothetical protein
MPDHLHISLSEFSFMISLSQSISSLTYHVSNVLLVGPKKQMLRIDAVPYVAAMTDEHPGGDLTYKLSIGCAVCAIYLSIYADVPITLVIHRLDP